MNPTLLPVVTAAVAIVSIILSIFAAAWLNQQQMAKLVDQLDKRIGEQGERFDAKLETVRVEVAGLSERVGRIERQLDQIFKPVLPGGER